MTFKLATERVKIMFINETKGFKGQNCNVKIFRIHRRSINFNNLFRRKKRKLTNNTFYSNKEAIFGR